MDGVLVAGVVVLEEVWVAGGLVSAVGGAGAACSGAGRVSPVSGGVSTAFGSVGCGPGGVGSALSCGLGCGGTEVSGSGVLVPFSCSAGVGFPLSWVAGGGLWESVGPTPVSGARVSGEAGTFGFGGVVGVPMSVLPGAAPGSFAAGFWECE